MTEKPGKKWFTDRNTILLIFLGTILIAYLCFLLISITNSHADLRKTILSQVRLDAERRNAALGYFFSERKDDILNLAISRETSVFFENRALGMSMEYGLSLSLIPIGDLFRDLLKRKKIGDDFIYSRVLLTDSHGAKLVDTGDFYPSGNAGDTWKDFIGPDSADGLVITSADGRELFISMSYFFKNEFSGQIIAWIRPEILFKLLPSHAGTSGRFTLITAGKEGVFLPSEHPTAFLSTELAGLAGGEPGIPRQFRVTGRNGQTKDMIAVRLPVPGTPLCMIDIIPAEDVYGTAPPWALPAAMGGVAAILLGGIVFVLRNNMKALVLQTRLSESAIREKAVSEKNLQLEAEIRERKRIEEALRENEKRFRGIIDNIKDIYYRTDTEGTIVMVSPSAAGLLGYENPEKYVGRSMADFWFDQEERNTFLRMLKNQGTVYDFEITLRKSDGSPLSVSVSSYFYYDALGAPLGIEGIARDITERKKAADELLQKKRELEELNRTLEVRVHEEVAKSREKDVLLIKQGRQAAMGEMIGNIAHQWRQPLNVLGIIVQNLQDAYEYGELTSGYLEEKVEKSMEIIQHMSRTIDSFRNFFMPDKEKQWFDTKETVEQAVSFIEASFRNNNIGIRTELQDGLRIHGYPNEYTQVLMNILGNAKDEFLRRKVTSPEVSIILFREGNKATVCIRDNAGGIPENIIDNIFEPYFTSKDQGEGTGIGLYMSKNIIEKNMDGRLTARNTDGGAEFRIEVECEE